MRRLGILLCTGPDEGDLPLVRALCGAALDDRREVAIFLMDEGARWAADPRLSPLLAAGVEVTVCAMDAEARGLSSAAIEALGVHLGSQHDHGRMIRDCDQVLSFT